MRATIAAAITAATAALLAPAATATAAPAASTLAPGSSVTITGGLKCTVGFVDTARAIAYTAGHCSKGLDSSAAVRSNTGKLVGYTWPANSRPENPDGGLEDARGYTAIALLDTVATTNELPNGVTITGPADQDDLFGANVCSYGATSGTTNCGKVVSNAANSIITTVANEPGDSGGPVYIRTDDGQARLAGIVIRRDRGDGRVAVGPATDILTNLNEKGIGFKTW